MFRPHDRQSGRGFVVFLLSLCLLGSLVYFVFIPYYNKFTLEKEIKFLLASDRYIDALSRIESVDDGVVPEFWINELKTVVINTAKERWRRYKMDIDAYLKASDVKSAMRTAITAKELLQGVSKGINSEIAAFLKIIEKIKTEEDLRRYEKEISKLIVSSDSSRNSNEGASLAKDSTEKPSLSQDKGNNHLSNHEGDDYKGNISRLRFYYQHAILNYSKRKEYRKYLLKALALQQRIYKHFKDELDNNFFLLKKQILDEKKRLGGRKDYKRFLRNGIDDLFREVDKDVGNKSGAVVVKQKLIWISDLLSLYETEFGTDSYLKRWRKKALEIRKEK